MSNSYSIQQTCQELLRSLVNDGASPGEVRAASALLKLGLRNRSGAAVARMVGVSRQQAHADIAALKKRGWIDIAKAAAAAMSTQCQPNVNLGPVVSPTCEPIFDNMVFFGNTRDPTIQQDNTTRGSTMSDQPYNLDLLLSEDPSCQVKSDNLIEVPSARVRVAHAVPELFTPELSVHEGVLKVFREWQSVMGHEKTRLSPARAKLIAKRISEYGVESCINAVRGCSRSPWHMGENPSGKRYDSIELIFRNEEKIEGFFELEEQQWRVLHSVQDMLNDAYRWYVEFIEHAAERPEREASQETMRKVAHWPEWMRPDLEVVTDTTHDGVIIPVWSLDTINAAGEDKNHLVKLHFWCRNRYAGAWSASQIRTKYGPPAEEIAVDYATGPVNDFAAVFAAAKEVVHAPFN